MAAKNPINPNAVIREKNSASRVEYNRNHGRAPDAPTSGRKWDRDMSKYTVRSKHSGKDVPVEYLG